MRNDHATLALQRPVLLEFGVSLSKSAVTIEMSLYCVQGTARADGVDTIELGSNHVPHQPLIGELDAADSNVLAHRGHLGATNTPGSKRPTAFKDAALVPTTLLNARHRYEHLAIGWHNDAHIEHPILSTADQGLTSHEQQRKVRWVVSNESGNLCRGLLGDQHSRSRARAVLAGHHVCVDGKETHAAPGDGPPDSDVVEADEGEGRCDAAHALLTHDVAPRVTWVMQTAHVTRALEELGNHWGVIADFPRLRKIADAAVHPAHLRTEFGGGEDVVDLLHGGIGAGAVAMSP